MPGWKKIVTKDNLTIQFDSSPALGGDLELNTHEIIANATDAIVFRTNTDRKLSLDFDGAASGKKLQLLSNHTDNRTLTFPDETGTLLSTASGISIQNDSNPVLAGDLQLNANKIIQSSTNPIIFRTNGSRDIKLDFDGAASNKALTLVSNHTLNRSIEFPNKSGTIALNDVATVSLDGLLSSSMFDSIQNTITPKADLITMKTLNTATKMFFYEGGDFGTSKVALQGSNAINSDIVVVLPSGDCTLSGTDLEETLSNKTFKGYTKFTSYDDDTDVLQVSSPNVDNLNYWKIRSGMNPYLEVKGDDTNINMDFYTKGSGEYQFHNGIAYGVWKLKGETNSASTLTLVNPTTAALGPRTVTFPNTTGTLEFTAAKNGLVPTPKEVSTSKYLRADGTWVVPPKVGYNESQSIEDSTGTKILLDFSDVSNAVNYLKVQNSITNTGPILESDGTDTNIDLVLRSKGTGKVALQDSSNGSQFRFDSSGASVLTQLTFSWSGTVNRTLTLPDSAGTVALVGVNETATNLGHSASGTALTVTSSTGTNVDLPLADTSNWGVMSDEMFDQLDIITSNTALDSTKIDLSEASDNGVNKITLKPSNNLASDYTITLPSITGTLPVQERGIVQFSDVSTSSEVKNQILQWSDTSNAWRNTNNLALDSSTNSESPNVTLKNTYAGTTSYPILSFINTNGGTSATNSIMGEMKFFTQNSSSDVEVAHIESRIIDNAASGEENAQIGFGVMSKGTYREKCFTIVGDNSASKNVVFRESRYGKNQMSGAILDQYVSAVYKSFNLSSSMEALEEASGANPKLEIILPPTTYGILLECTAYFDAVTSNRTIYADWTATTPGGGGTTASLFPEYEQAKRIKYPDETDDGQLVYRDVIKVSDMKIDILGDGSVAAPLEGATVTIYPMFKCSATNAYIRWGCAVSTTYRYPPLILKATVLTTSL